MEEDAFFIDQNWNKISAQGISSHIGLSKVLLESSEKLSEEFTESGRKDAVDFLVMDKGYIKVSDNGDYYRVVSFTHSKISDKQRRLLAYYREEGYRLDNLSKFEISFIAVRTVWRMHSVQKKSPQIKVNFSFISWKHIEQLFSA